MADNYFNRALNAAVESRRMLGKPTLAADYVDARTASGQWTPMANLLGYNSPAQPNSVGNAGPCPTGMKRDAYGNCKPDYMPQVSSARETCINQHPKNKWVVNPVTGQGYCDTSGQVEPTPSGRDIETGAGLGKPLGYLDSSTLQVEADKTPLPWMKTGAYADALAQMLNSPAFGGQTLEELENARIQAMRQGSAENFGYAADEMTRRLAQQAQAKGMYTSSAHGQNLQQGLGDLLRQKTAQEAQYEADIRGERPGLLLQQRQQQAEIANIWGTMDLNAQAQNLDGALQGRLLEYDRQLKNSNLTLSAFNGNMNLLGMFLDYELNSARTDNDSRLVMAQIDKLYNDMSLEQRSTFQNLIQMMISGFAGGFGNK
jgi:hypothetical protein